MIGIGDSSQKMIELLPTFITYGTDISGNFVIKTVKNRQNNFDTLFLFRKIEKKMIET